LKPENQQAITQVIFENGKVKLEGVYCWTANLQMFPNITKTLSRLNIK
jgi:hypothetical protein